MKSNKLYGVKFSKDEMRALSQKSFATHEVRKIPAGLSVTHKEAATFALTSAPAQEEVAA